MHEDKYLHGFVDEFEAEVFKHKYPAQSLSYLEILIGPCPNV